MLENNKLKTIFLYLFQEYRQIFETFAKLVRNRSSMTDYLEFVPNNRNVVNTSEAKTKTMNEYVFFVFDVSENFFSKLSWR